MRTVAAYSMTRPVADAGQTSADLAGSLHMVEEWLRDKGARELSVGQREFPLPGGRIARLTREHMETDDGTLDSFVLNEPVNDGRFETRFSLACASTELVLFCQLATGNAESAFAPVQFDARCPRVLRDVIQSGAWKSGSTPVSDRHWSRVGRAAGRGLADTIWDDERGLPVVLVSELDGFTLHPDLAANLAHDLTGLATVVHIDEDASWLLSDVKGREWSCYSGALRLYWPFHDTRNDPDSHPLWTQGHLLRGGMDSITAANLVRNRLRRRIFGQSAFQAAPPLVVQIRDRYVATQRKQARDAGEYGVLLDHAEQEIRDINQQLHEREREVEGLEAQIEILSEENEDLKAQVRSLRFVRDWTKGADNVSDEEPDTPPSTVRDAVQRAMNECELLRFGSDVLEGVADLAPNAGGPSKILDYLRTLNTMTVQMNEGPLGDDMLSWLRRKSIKVSGESETILNSRREMAKRTWDDGSGKKRRFEKHMKPSDKTSPDRCVRIYFDYDEQLGKTIVGWVGRHLD